MDSSSLTNQNPIVNMKNLHLCIMLYLYINNAKVPTYLPLSLDLTCIMLRGDIDKTKWNIPPLSLTHTQVMKLVLRTSALPMTNTTLVPAALHNMLCFYWNATVLNLWWLSYLKQKKNALLYMSFTEKAICNTSCVHEQVQIFMLRLLINMHKLSCT